MNDGKESQNEKLEKLLRKARLPEPLPELKDRITAEATRVWRQASVELSWRVPFRRLVASAAAAVFVIWLANFSSDYSLARWQTSGPTTHRQPSELEILTEIPYSPFVRHLTSAHHKLPMADDSGLRHYIETVRQLLDEAPWNDIANPPDPVKGRSRLLPDRFNPSSYS